MAIVIPHNFILFVCVAIVVSIVVFVIYGSIRGFGNIFKEYENPDGEQQSR